MYTHVHIPFANAYIYIRIYLCAHMLYRTDDVLDLIEELMAPFRALSASRLIEQDEDEDEDDDNSDNDAVAIDNPTTTTPSAAGTAAAAEGKGHNSDPPPTAAATATSALPNILDGDESRIFEKSFEGEWSKLMKEFRVRVKAIEKTLEMSMQEGFNKLRSAEGTVHLRVAYCI